MNQESGVSRWHKQLQETQAAPQCVWPGMEWTVARRQFRMRWQNRWTSFDINHLRFRNSELFIIIFIIISHHLITVNQNFSGFCLSWTKWFPPVSIRRGRRFCARPLICLPWRFAFAWGRVWRRLGPSMWLVLFGSPKWQLLYDIFVEYLLSLRYVL